jgi:rhodanese-related sulfurtransferase
VAQELEDRGYKDVHALHGGYDAWVKAGLPVEPRAEREAYSRTP